MKGSKDMGYKEIDPKQIKENPIKMIADNWALLAAGTKENHNAMTISWGMVGELWGRDAVMAFVRPHRHTFGIMETSDYYSLSFMGDEHRGVHKIFGSKSGRDMDKFEAAGMKPAYHNGHIFVDEAELVIICKKIAYQDFNPAGFIDKSIEELYPIQDYHRIYVGEIVSVLKKD